MSIIQVPPIEAIWQPSFTLPPTSARSISRAAIPYRIAFSVSPTCAAMIASTQDDSDESPVVSAALPPWNKISWVVMTAYGGVGGFGVGAHTDWQVLGTIDYSLSQSN